MIPNGKLSLLLILSVELHCPSLSSALTCGARKYYHYCGNPSRFTTRVRRTRPSAPPPRHSDQWPVRIDSSITRLYVDKDSNDGTNPSPERWAKTRSRPALFTLLISIAGAILGPFLDTYHSVFGVLLYEKPISLVLWGSADFPGLVTAWWVPELFALAGFIIGWLYILLDDVLPTGQVSRKSPTPPTILFGIALFTLQYWLSGLLYQTGMDRTIILNVMSTIAVVGFYYLDGTLAGGLVSAATAMGGPLIELLLLSLSRSGGMGDSGYQYLDLGETGFFPLWIVPVYFLGAQPWVIWHVEFGIPLPVPRSPRKVAKWMILRHVQLVTILGEFPVPTVMALGDISPWADVPSIVRRAGDEDLYYAVSASISMVKTQTMLRPYVTFCHVCPIERHTHCKVVGLVTLPPSKQQNVSCCTLYF